MYNLDSDWDDKKFVSCYRTELLFDKSNVDRVTGPLKELQNIPEIRRRLRRHPDRVLQDFREIKEYCMCALLELSFSVANLIIVANPARLKFSVAGNILDLPAPRSVWMKCFCDHLCVGGLCIRKSRLLITRQNVPLTPVRRLHETLSDIGRSPQKKVRKLLLTCAYQLNGLTGLRPSSSAM